jgi:hypothetical protein
MDDKKGLDYGLWSKFLRILGNEKEEKPAAVDAGIKGAPDNERGKR